MATKKEPAKKAPAKKAATKKATAKKPVKKAPTKKVAAKKEAVKKSAKKTVKPVGDKINATKIGKNLIIYVDGTKYTVKSPTAEVEKSISNKCKLYNAKNNDALKEQIVRMISPAVAVKEEKIAKTKGIKKAVKKIKEVAAKSNEDLESTAEQKTEQEAVTVEAKVSLSYEEMNRIEQESIRKDGKPNRGYKHPVTGRTWNGERYV